MKKISLLVLVVISFLFVGMMIPNVHAAAPSGEFTVKVSALTTEDILWTEASTYSSDPQSYGSTFSIDASTIVIEDMTFAFWLVNGSITDRPANTTFIVTTDLEVIAVFKPFDKHVVLYVDSNNQLVDTKYVLNDGSSSTLLNSTNLTKPGMVFVGWDTPQTNITEDIIIRALYDLDETTAQVTITIADETGLGAGTFDYNSLVTVTASVPGFTHWTEDGEVVSYDPTYTFSAIKNRTLKAETGGTEAPVVFLQDVTGIRAQSESYLGQIHLPSGYTLFEAGLLVSDTVAVPTYGVAGVEAIVSNSINPATNEFLRSIQGTSEYRFVRAYAVVSNGENTEVIYSINAKHSVDVTFQLWVNKSWDPRPQVSVVGNFTNWATNQVPMTLQTEPDNNYLATIRIEWFGSYNVQYTAEYKYLYNPGPNEFYKPDGPNLVLTVNPGISEQVLEFTGGH